MNGHREAVQLGVLLAMWEMRGEIPELITTCVQRGETGLAAQLGQVLEIFDASRQWDSP